MNDRKPHFFEVFLPNLSSQRLEVPSKFNKHLRGITSGAISLIGPSGDKWHVDLIDNDDRLFFDDGWPTFVKDHSVQFGDFLVFRYDGNSQFTVQIFDQTSCEKEEAFNATRSQESMNCNGDSGKKRERDKEVYFMDVVCEKKHKGTLSPAQLDLPAGNEEKGLIFSSIWEVPTVLGLPCALNTEWKATVVKPDSKAFTGKTDAKKKKKLKGKTAAKKKQKGKTAAKKKQNTAIDISISKFIESRAQEYITPSSPYFVRVMNYSNISGKRTMNVPTKFSAVHLPNYKTKVTLRNLNGHCWMVTCVTEAYKSKNRCAFTAGWIAFVRENGIKIEDVCIFELVGELEMVVRILRLDVDQTENNVFVEISGRHSESAADITQYTSGDQLLNDSEQLSDFNMYDNGDHKEDIEIIPASPHEVKVELLQKSPSRSGQSPLSSTCGGVYSDRLMCNAEGLILDETSKENEDVVFNEIIDNPALVEAAADYLTFTSPFPNFMKTMKDSSIGKRASLNVPMTFSAAHLLFHKKSIVLRNMKGNSWVVNVVRYGLRTKLLCGGWISFVHDNGVKVGDVCIFELVDEKVLQVRVFKGGHKSHKRQIGNVADDSTRCTDLPHVEECMNFRPDMNLLCDAEGPILDETGIDNVVLDFNEIIDNPALVKEATECATFTSPFPNFMKTMRDSSYYTLNVPRKFSAAHLPFHKSNIVLRNMEGNSWVVNATRYGLHFKLRGGWMSFVLDNGVKVGDVFIFELVDEKVFQVRIFKGGRKGQECQINEVADDSTICSVLSHIEAYLDQVRGRWKIERQWFGGRCRMGKPMAGYIEIVLVGT